MINIEPRDHYVFFANHEVIVFKQDRQMVCTTCDGEVFFSTPCPIAYNRYVLEEKNGNILFLFAGKDIIYISMDGSFTSCVDNSKFGRLSSQIYQDGPCLISSSHLHGQVQLIKYNFVDKSRVWQSASKKVSRVTDTCLDNDSIYVLMDNSYLINCDKNTGEIKWSRFETSMVDPHILPYKGSIMYSCRHVIRLVNGKNVRNILIPISRPDTLESIYRGNLVYTSQKKTHICSYDIENDKIQWEIEGTQPISRTISKDNMLFVQMTDNIVIVNMDTGKIVNNYRIHNIEDMIKSSDHVIIHRKNGKSVLISGV